MRSQVNTYIVYCTERERERTYATAKSLMDKNSDDILPWWLGFLHMKQQREREGVGREYLDGAKMVICNLVTISLWVILFPHFFLSVTPFLKFSLCSLVILSNYLFIIHHIHPDAATILQTQTHQTRHHATNHHYNPLSTSPFSVFLKLQPQPLRSKSRILKEHFKSRVNEEQGGVR